MMKKYCINLYPQENKINFIVFIPKKINKITRECFFDRKDILYLHNYENNFWDYNREGYEFVEDTSYLTCFRKLKLVKRNLIMKIFEV